MQIIHAIILGIVEGLSEFLPISSTGHLILTGRLLALEQTEFLKTFEIAIQLGAILSVVAVYWRQLLVDQEVIKRVAAAFLPTAVLGLVFYKIIKKFLLNSHDVVLWALLIGGVVLIVFEKYYNDKSGIDDELRSMPYHKAVLIGIAQSFAMIPGVSRSAATILGGLALGIKRKTIVEFSFLLAVPTMLAACGLDLIKSGHQFSVEQFVLLAAGFVTSFVVALASIKFFIRYIQTHSFIVFGFYRVALALLFWMFYR